jgi:outer membrane protein assembly factor BamB
VRAADDDGPPSPGGSGGSGGGATTSFVIPSYTVTSNCVDWTNFWLVISNTGTAAQVGIESTLSGISYNLLTNNDLSTTNWGLYQTLTATSSLTWATPFSFADSTNLFFKGQVIWPRVDWVTPLVCIGDQWGNGVDASPALSYDGSTVYIPSTGNLLYALDASTGAILTSNAITTQEGEMTSSAAIASNGDVYMGSTDGFLFSFTTNLTTNWSINLTNLVTTDGEAAVFATPAVTADGSIYVGLEEAGQNPITGTGFFSFNANSNENWFFIPENLTNNSFGDVDSSAAVGADCTTYFLSEDWRLYALYPSGNVKWFLPIPAQTEPDSSPAIAADGTIIIGSDSPYVYAVNPDGSLKWVCHIPNTDDANLAVFSSPVIDSNGVAYVGTGWPTNHVQDYGPSLTFPGGLSEPALWARMGRSMLAPRRGTIHLARSMLFLMACNSGPSRPATILFRRL